MNQESSTIKSFIDLNAWKKGHELVLNIYRLTSRFPKEEFISLADLSVEVNKLLNGLIKKSKTMIHNS